MRRGPIFHWSLISHQIIGWTPQSTLDPSSRCDQDVHLPGHLPQTSFPSLHMPGYQLRHLKHANAFLTVEHHFQILIGIDLGPHLFPANGFCSKTGTAEPEAVFKQG
jgi:hypothetical protein